MSIRDRIRARVQRLIVRFGLLVVLTTFSACGGGGGGASTGGSGGIGTGGSGQPTIVATVITFMSGDVPPGFVTAGRNSLAAVKITDQSGALVTNAVVTVEGVALSYIAADQQYEVALDISPGATVTVSSTVDGIAYTASRTNFSTYPTITAPGAAATWSAQAANLISWSGVVPDSTAQFALGIFDSSGALAWPAGGLLMTAPGSQTSATVSPGSLAAGSDLLLVGIIDAGTFPGAAAGSGVGIGGFTYVPVTVIATTAAVESVAATPATVTVTPGRSTQLAATASYSDGTNVDVTAQATWLSSDTTKVTVSGSGVVTGVAAGSASVTAQFAGFTGSSTVTIFQPNPSPSPPLTQSVSYQVDYAHTGRATVGGSGPTFPPAAQWSTTLSGTSISYPIIAGGKVFVTTNATPPGMSYGTTLYALEETSGTVVWGPVPLSGTYSFSAATYDHGTLFVLNFDGLLRTFDPATGTPGWSVQLPGQYQVTSPPTAVNGIVYVTGNVGLNAVDETNGQVLWTANTAAGDHTSPTVSADGVFISGPCAALKFDPLVGTALWVFAEACGGGGGKTTVYANGDLYVRELFDTTTSHEVNLVLDGATGRNIEPFNAGPMPAFNDTTGFFLNNATLTATTLSTGNTLWTFTGDGGLSSAPLIIDGTVVIGSSSGTLYALDASNGTVLWSSVLGAAIYPADEQNATLTTGLGAGEGYLVVPAGSVLYGWRLIP